jgi:hypothetical protein
VRSLSEWVFLRDAHGVENALRFVLRGVAAGDLVVFLGVYC